MKKRITVVYVRVSSNPQSTKSQIPALKQYVKNNAEDLGNVKWLTEKFTGKTMQRPKWDKLQRAIVHNRVKCLIIWKLDRLGRTALGLHKLFEELKAHKVKLVSVTEGFDLSSSTGKVLAGLLASLAEWENETRTERIRAGQQAAKAEGKTWGGSKKGALHKHTKEQVRQIVKMHKAGEKVGVIAKTVGTHRQNIYRILKRVKEGNIKV